LSEIDWAVVTNGLDFLESAVDHLATGGERALRYAAVHLNAAIETLLKAQLAREHWALVVDDVDRADRRAYDTGGFRSVNITKALQRLRAVASSVTDEEIVRIKAVERLRNQVAHFAVPGENPRRTEVIIARGLDVLLHFIDREFPGTHARTDCGPAAIPAGGRGRRGAARVADRDRRSRRPGVR
jgi:hypothetical protein